MFAEGGSHKNHSYVGVPGTVRGLSLAREIYGALPWKDLVEPAVRLAVDGFAMHGGLAGDLNKVLETSTNEEFKRVYGKPDGAAWQAGDRIVLTDLGAKTNHLIIEAMRRGYAKRAQYLGDADFVNISAHLTTKAFARHLAVDIDLHKATPRDAHSIVLTKDGARAVVDSRWGGAAAAAQ